ncbi:MAG: Wzz/FepE/Etk N-terminal domain-containing protein [Spirosomataceae bacterium]
MSHSENVSANPSDEIEINLADILVFLKKNIRAIVLWGVGFACIGAIYALSLQKEFDADTQLMPELQSNSSLSKMGSLSALAGLAGVDLNQMSNTDAVRPDLYPNIVQTLPFALYILEQKVYVSEYKKIMTLQEYLNKKEKSWISDLLGNEANIDSSNILDPKKLSKAYELTKSQERIIKQIHERIIAVFDRKTGVITIHSKMPDPVVAATTAQMAVEYLKEYVTNYRTDKARKQVTFLSGQVAESKKRYQSSEAALAVYRDRNRFLVMESAKIEEQRLQGDFILAQTVFNNLSQQYEQAKIRVEEETPVFKTLDPPAIPLKRSAPKRTIIVLVFAFLGALIAISIGIYKNNSLKGILKNTKKGL